MQIRMIKAEESFRQGFKYFNRFMLLIWRLGLGEWLNASPKYGGRIMVITHTGRRSGVKRRTPVNYSLIDGELYCTAGFGRQSDWYRNLLANPQVEIWLPGEWWAGCAEDVSDSPQRLAVMRQVLKDSGLAAFAAGINPYQLSDEDLAQETETYRLVHIRRAEARTGPGGPGDLAWVWPAAVLLGLPLMWLSRRRRCGR